MFIEVRSGEYKIHINTDYIISLHRKKIAMDYNKVIYVTEITFTNTVIQCDDKVYDIILNSIAREKLTIWQKIRISFVGWLKGLKLMKSSPEQ